jgi:hypothetical protein
LLSLAFSTNRLALPIHTGALTSGFAGLPFTMSPSGTNVTSIRSLLARSDACSARLIGEGGAATGQQDDHHEGTYRLTAPIGDLPLVSLSQGELLPLYFADKVLRQYRGTPFESDLASAFAKMQELLPEEVKASPESLDAYLFPAAVPARRRERESSGGQHNWGTAPCGVRLRPGVLRPG